MKPKKNPSKKTSQQVKGDWDMYSNDNKDATTHFNIAYKKLAPIKSMPNLARVNIKMNDPRPDGLSSEEESETFNKIVMPIANNNAFHVAIYTGGGKWIVYYYCNDTDSFKETVSDVMAGFPEYEFDVDIQEDKQWKVYFELFPSERQIHSMGNRHLIEQLIILGADLSHARIVEHSVFFKNKADRKSFLKESKKQGFTVSNQFYEKSLNDHPYVLEISRVDKVDWTSIDEIVFQLLDLTYLHHGFYDGWAIFMAKDEIKQP